MVRIKYSIFSEALPPGCPPGPLLLKLACCTCFKLMFIFFWIHASQVMACLLQTALGIFDTTIVSLLGVLKESRRCKTCLTFIIQGIIYNMRARQMSNDRKCRMQYHSQIGTKKSELPSVSKLFYIFF